MSFSSLSASSLVFSRSLKKLAVASGLRCGEERSFLCELGVATGLGLGSPHKLEMLDCRLDGVLMTTSCARARKLEHQTLEPTRLVCLLLLFWCCCYCVFALCWFCLFRLRDQKNCLFRVRPEFAYFAGDILKQLLGSFETSSTSAFVSVETSSK